MLDNPTKTRPGEALDLAALQPYLNGHVSGFGPIDGVSQFPGGYSNLTYLLTTKSREYVLRRPPVGAKDIKGGHDMGREFRVLTLLQQAGYRKIPEPVIFCDDESVMGYPFYVMARVPGVILRAHTAQKMGITPEVMHQLSASLVDSLVDLHSLNIRETGLIDLGKPEGYVQRQVSGWHKRYNVAQTDAIADMDTLSRYLTGQLPPEADTPTLLHNDFKYDNVVLNPDRLPDVRAVLDWEMCTVGDPLMDLGTSLSYWSEAGDDTFRKTFNLTWLPGNLTRQEVARRYADQSGRDVSRLLYYYVFGLFKNAVVLQQIYGRYKKGLTQDARFAALGQGVRVLARAGVQAVETELF